METKKVQVIISFSQSKKYPTDWKVRYNFQDKGKTILVLDEISKTTRFGEVIDGERMVAYATTKANEISNGFGCEFEIVFA